MKVSTKLFKPMLREFYPARAYMIPLFLGASGIGKTDLVNELAQELGVDVITINLADCEPGEVRGFKVPDDERKLAAVFDDEKLRSLKDGDILFLDEILEAPPAVWSGCLTLLQSRMLASGRKLPDVFIVAASNPIAAPSSIAASVRDRFQVIELHFDFDTWAAWFKRTRHVRPLTRLRSYIQGDGDQWNILTARRFTKLYDWYMLGGDLELKDKVIESMFDLSILEIVKDMASAKPDAHDQIASAIEDMVELPDNWDSMPLVDVLAWLQGLDNWYEISKVLSSTKLVG